MLTFRQARLRPTASPREPTRPRRSATTRCACASLVPMPQLFRLLARSIRRRRHRSPTRSAPRRPMPTNAAHVDDSDEHARAARHRPSAASRGEAADSVREGSAHDAHDLDMAVASPHVRAAYMWRWTALCVCTVGVDARCEHCPKNTVLSHSCRVWKLKSVCGQVTDPLLLRNCLRSGGSRAGGRGVGSQA